MIHFYFFLLCFYSGAVQILRDLDNIDFHLLMAGKICLDEQSRVKRVARLDCIKMPVFMRDLTKYKQKLRRMAILNDLHLHHPPRFAPPAYLLRLEQRRNRVRPAESVEPRRQRKVRKRHRQRFAVSSVLPSASTSESEVVATPTNDEEGVACSEVDVEDYRNSASSLASASPPYLRCKLSAAYPASPRRGKAKFADSISPMDNCSNNEVLDLQSSSLCSSPDEMGARVDVSSQTSHSSQQTDISSLSPQISQLPQESSHCCKSLVKNKEPPKCSKRILSFIYPNDTDFELSKAALPLLSKPPKSGGVRRPPASKSGQENGTLERSITPASSGGGCEVAARRKIKSRLLAKRAQSAVAETYDQRFTTQA